jgi:predicted Rossmann fold nucleotide-binding protein DprA/Smf involved in DNA uptake
MNALHDAYYGKEYAAKWFFQRNKMLASYVDYLIAFMDTETNGTVNTIKEARKKGKKVVIIT